MLHKKSRNLQTYKYNTLWKNFKGNIEIRLHIKRKTTEEDRILTISEEKEKGI